MMWRQALTPLLAAAVVASVAGCGGEPAEPPTAAAVAVQPAETAAPSRPAAEPAPTVTSAPVPTRATAKSEATVASDAVPTATPGGVRPLPRPVVPGVELHDSQVVTAPGRMRETLAPWRDGGGNRFFSTHVFGTPFMLDEEGNLSPWLATAITSDEEGFVWTMKLREDAVFQDGTPIRAADFKAYWEHGAKPENLPAWGGASLTLVNIDGWTELMNGEAAEASGLTVVDDHTLVMDVVGKEKEIDDTWYDTLPVVTWPLYMAAWHVGISKPGQVEEDVRWGSAPIGAGPYSLRYDAETGLTELTRVDLVGGHWNGPHGAPIIEKLVLPNIEDERARLVMFENGDLDLMRVDNETYHAALDSSHPFHPLLYASPYGGLQFIRLEEASPYIPLTPLKESPWPMDDFWVRKALAHGVDMKKVVATLWGPSAVHAKGPISRRVPCHNPETDRQPYDPDLARQYLSQLRYVRVDDLPPLRIDLSRPDTYALGRAVKTYWKDNLDIDLEISDGENPMSRRRLGFLLSIALEGRIGPAELRHVTLDSWSPDPSQIMANLRPAYVRGFFHVRPHAPIYRAVSASHPGALSMPDILHMLFWHALSLPLDAPERCEVFQGVEWEYLDKAYMIPIREVEPVKWVVQPWLRGFESTFNQDFNTLTTAYVVRH